MKRVLGVLFIVVAILIYGHGLYFSHVTQDKDLVFKINNMNLAVSLIVMTSGALILAKRKKN